MFPCRYCSTLNDSDRSGSVVYFRCTSCGRRNTNLKLSLPSEPEKYNPPICPVCKANIVEKEIDFLIWHKFNCPGQRELDAEFLLSPLPLPNGFNYWKYISDGLGEDQRDDRERGVRLRVASGEPAAVDSEEGVGDVDRGASCAKERVDSETSVGGEGRERATLAAAAVS